MAETLGTKGKVGQPDGGDEATQIATHGIIQDTAPAVANPVPSAINCFRDGEEYVVDTLTKFGTVAVTLVDTDGNQTPSIATPGMTVFKWTDENSVTQRKQSRDFIILVDNYRFQMTPRQPEEYDQIFEDVGSTRYIYDVGAFNDEPPWRWFGKYRFAYRIHTKLIKEVLI